MRPSHITSLLVIAIGLVFALDVVAIDRATFVMMVTGVLAVGIILDLMEQDEHR